MLSLQSKNEGDVSVELNKSRLNIGRDAGNDLVLDDAAISGFHAGVFCENGRVELVDLGSTNGTFVNGKRLTGRIELKPWDTVQFGKTEMEVVDPAGRRPTSVMAAISDDMLGKQADPASISSTNTAKAVLKAIMPGKGPADYQITGRVRVGRAPDSDLVLPASTVSSRHAEILVDDQGLQVVDLGSTNGTFVNGRKVSRQLLTDGDHVRFDEVEYRVEMRQPGNGKTALNAAVSFRPGDTACNPALKKELPGIPTPAPDALPKVLPKVGRDIQEDIPTRSGDSGGLPAVSASDAATRMEPGPCRDIGAPGAASPATVVGQSSAPPPRMKAPEMPTLKSSPPMSERPSTGARGTSDVEQSGIGWLYFSTRGRLGRMNYFLSALLLAAIGIGLNLIVQQVFYGRISFEPSPNYMAGTFAAFILNLWPSIALGAKRFHDQDRSGHFLWLFFIPLANLAAGIMLLFVPGTAGPNRFGSPRE